MYAPAQGGNAGSVRRLVFALCRRLKAEGGGTDEDALKGFFQAHQKALGGLGWDDFRLMVLEGLDRVKVPVGAGLLATAIAEADKRTSPACVSPYSAQPLRRLVGLCAVLQERVGTNPFFLASHSVADELGASPVTVAGWLRLLVRDGVLALVAKGHRGRATEYRYIGNSTTADYDGDGPYRGDRL